MILSTFETRVRARLADDNTFFTNIEETLDEWIESNYQWLIKQKGEFYLSTVEITAVADQENYDISASAADFKSVAWIRRNDLTEKPIIPHETMREQDSWRGVPAILYNRNSALSVGLETWTMLDTVNMKIIPAPSSTSTLFGVWYYRKHTATAASGDTVDIADEFLPLAIISVAYEIAILNNDPVADRLRILRDEKKRAFEVRLYQGNPILGEVRSWPR